jgi:hypothetical protein
MSTVLIMISCNRFISIVSLLQLIDLSVPFGHLSTLRSCAVFELICNASGHAKPPGVGQGGNGSLCRSFPSCVLLSEGNLSHLALCFNVCLLSCDKLLVPWPSFVHPLPSFLYLSYAMYTYVFGLLLYE